MFKRILLATALICLLTATSSMAAFSGLLSKDCQIIALAAYETNPNIWVTWDGLGKNVKYLIKSDSANVKVVYSTLLTAISLNKTVRLYFTDGYITGVQLTP